MAYRIVYGPMPKVPKDKVGGSFRLRLLTAVFALLFVLAVRQVWPEGTRMLRTFLLPGEQTVTEAAFSSMMNEIRQGEPVGEAVEAFCRQIMENGQATG